LAKAFKKYQVIIFKDKDGNIINDNNNPEHENTEITRVMEPEQDIQNDNDEIEGENTNTDTQHNITMKSSQKRPQECNKMI